MHKTRYEHRASLLYVVEAKKMKSWHFFITYANTYDGIDPKIPRYPEEGSLEATFSWKEFTKFVKATRDLGDDYWYRVHEISGLEQLVDEKKRETRERFNARYGKERVDRAERAAQTKKEERIAKAERTEVKNLIKRLQIKIQQKIENEKHRNKFEDDVIY